MAKKYLKKINILQKKTKKEGDEDMPFFLPLVEIPFWRSEMF